MFALPSWLAAATGAAKFANNPANGFQPTWGDALQGIGSSMMNHYRRGQEGPKAAAQQPGTTIESPAIVPNALDQIAALMAERHAPPPMTQFQPSTAPLAGLGSEIAAFAPDPNAPATLDPLAYARRLRQQAFSPFGIQIDPRLF